MIRGYNISERLAMLSALGIIGAAVIGTTAFGSTKKPVEPTPRVSYVQEVIKVFEKEKYEVIYGDTDSVYLGLGKKKKEDAIKIMNKINKKLPETMELELENYYKRGVFVRKKRRRNKRS